MTSKKQTTEKTNMACYTTDKDAFRKLVSRAGLVAVGDTEADLFRKLLEDYKKVKGIK